MSDDAAHRLADLAVADRLDANPNKTREVRALLDPDLIRHMRSAVRRGEMRGPGARFARPGGARGHYDKEIQEAQALISLTWTQAKVPPPSAQRAMRAGLHMPSGADWPTVWIEQLLIKLWNHRWARWERPTDADFKAILAAWFPSTAWLEEDLWNDEAESIPGYRSVQAFYWPEWFEIPDLATIFPEAPPQKPTFRELPFGADDEEDEKWQDKKANRPRPLRHGDR